jgi:hypothetical protein
LGMDETFSSQEHGAVENSDRKAACVFVHVATRHSMFNTPTELNFGGISFTSVMVHLGQIRSAALLVIW